MHMDELLKQRLDKVAASLWDARNELEEIKDKHLTGIDKRACHRIIIDLAWAVENCTVLGLHQIGLALDDKMGLEPPDVCPNCKGKEQWYSEDNGQVITCPVCNVKTW